MQKQIKNIQLLVIVICLFTGFITACNGSKSNVVVSNVEIKPDVGITSSGLDAGMTVIYILKNLGESSSIKVVQHLSCSEGEWARRRTVYMNAGETKKLSCFFHEPTINARDFEAYIY